MGRVSAVTRFGIFVELEDFFVEGLIRLDQLGGDDFFEFDEAAHQVFGRRSGRSFRIGDRVEIEVTAASLQRRTIDFALVRKVGEV